MQRSQLSLTALLVAAASSAAAAVVVHALWAPGTILGAALTPVLISLFDELLRRPAERLNHAGRKRADAGAPRGEVSEELPAYRIYRVWPRWWRALATGASAFLIGAGTLTAAELAFDQSLTDRSDRTTLLGGRRDSRPPSAPPTPTQLPDPREDAPAVKSSPASPRSDGRATSEGQTTPSERASPTPTVPSDANPAQDGAPTPVPPLPASPSATPPSEAPSPP